MGNTIAPARMTPKNSRRLILTEADLYIDNVRIVDVLTGEIRPGGVAVHEGRIIGFEPRNAKERFDGKGRFLLPGLIDSHVHIESSMLAPIGFAALVLPMGTTTVIADPHEIANVGGEKAVLGLLEAVRNLPLSVKLMVPSCVPALPFEETGSSLDAEAVERLLANPDIFGLGELMNVSGLLAGDPEVLRKVEAARRLGKPVDGHAPLLTGPDLETYAAHGIMTDHECSTTDELKERIRLGMYVSIREGSLARNLSALVKDLTPAMTRRCTFCTDDRHAADTLERGHIASLLRQAVERGLNPIDAVRMATLNTAECYGLHDRGAIAPGRRADLVLVDDLSGFEPAAVWTEGRLIACNRKMVATLPEPTVRNFMGDTVRIAPPNDHSFDLKAPSGKARMIGLLPHSLITTNKTVCVNTDADGCVNLADNPGLIKLAVVERHHATGHVGVTLLDPAYGLRNGAVATSVSHDSHNIVVAGDSEADMRLAVETVDRLHGGIVMVSRGEVLDSLPLPVAGLMSDRMPEEAADGIRRLTALAYEHFGITKDNDAFMTLSFLALPVIPHLKLTSLGLFDVDAFKFIDSDI